MLLSAVVQTKDRERLRERPRGILLKGCEGNQECGEIESILPVQCADQVWLCASLGMVPTGRHCVALMVALRSMYRLQENAVCLWGVSFADCGTGYGCICMRSGQLGIQQALILFKS